MGGFCIDAVFFYSCGVADVFFVCGWLGICMIINYYLVSGLIIASQYHGYRLILDCSYIDWQYLTIGNISFAIGDIFSDAPNSQKGCFLFRFESNYML